MTRLSIASVWLTTFLCGIVWTTPLAAAERWTIGLTANDAPIEALVIPGSSASASTVLLVGGLHGSDASVDAVRREAEAFEARPQAQRPFRLIAVPHANPETNDLQFPPTGTAYRDHAVSHVLWRWIGIPRRISS